MAVWGDKRIKKMVADGLITSKDDISVGNASLDVRLGYSYKRLMPRDAVELGERLTFVDECCGEDGVIINPGEFMLATTKEYIRFPSDCSGFVHGRSSIGRLGLTVQKGATSTRMEQDYENNGTD